MARTRLTDTEREQRRQGDRDRLEHAARDLLCTDGWQRWMRVRATNGLARYSIRNLAPIPITDRDANNEKTEETRVLFRAVPVFDVAQTEPLPGLDPTQAGPIRALRAPAGPTSGRRLKCCGGRRDRVDPWVRGLSHQAPRWSDRSRAELGGPSRQRPCSSARTGHLAPSCLRSSCS